MSRIHKNKKQKKSRLRRCCLINMQLHASVYFRYIIIGYLPIFSYPVIFCLHLLLPTTFVFPSINYASVLIKLNSTTGIFVITLTSRGGYFTQFSIKTMNRKRFKKKKIACGAKKNKKKSKKRPKLTLPKILRSTTKVSGFDNESVDKNCWVEH